MAPPPHPARKRVAKNKTPILNIKFPLQTGIGMANPLRPEELRPKNINFRLLKSEYFSPVSQFHPRRRISLEKNER
jgi:hypothetical protein